MPDDKETKNQKGADDGEKQSEEETQAQADAQVDPETPVNPETPETPETPLDPPVDPETPEKDAAPAIGSTKAGTKNNTQKAKKAADAKRRQQIIDDRPEPPAPSEADVEEETRKAGIQDELAELHANEQEFLGAIEEIKAQRRDLMAELYPHLTKSDCHADAVRGYVASQKKIRATRATDPVRLASMLKQMGKAPIDAAFHRQRARGMARPNRAPAASKPATEKQE